MGETLNGCISGGFRRLRAFLGPTFRSSLRARSAVNEILGNRSAFSGSPI
jgi:hypothetical protein